MEGGRGIPEGLSVWQHQFATAEPQIRFREPLDDNGITLLYCCLDGLCQVFADVHTHRLIPSAQTGNVRKAVARRDAVHRGAVPLLGVQEFQNNLFLIGSDNQHRAYFGNLPHHGRFVNVMPRLFAPLIVLLHSLSGEQTGAYFAPTQPSSASATIAASIAIGRSTACPHAAKPEWGRSTGSNCTP